MLSFVVLDGSDVAAEDVDPDDLLNATSVGMLFLTFGDLVMAGLVGDEPIAVDLAPILDPAEDLLPIALPAAACGDVVVASVGGPGGDDVVAIDVATGEERWRVDAPDPEGGHPVACGDGDVAVTYDATATVGLSLADGSVAWSTPVHGDDPPLAVGDAAIVGSYDGIVVMDLETGAERWRVGESSDFVVTVGASGVVIDESQGPTLYSLDGEQLALFPTLSDDVREQLGGSFDVGDLRVAGPADAPVLTILGTSVVVELDGTVRAVTDEDAEVVGTSGELIWVLRDGREEVVIERVTADGDVQDATRTEEDFEASLGTDRFLFGHVDGEPAMVLTLF